MSIYFAALSLRSFGFFLPYNHSLEQDSKRSSNYHAHRFFWGLLHFVTLFETWPGRRYCPTSLIPSFLAVASAWQRGRLGSRVLLWV